LTRSQLAAVPYNRWLRTACGRLRGGALGRQAPERRQRSTRVNQRINGVGMVDQIQRHVNLVIWSFGRFGHWVI
jgi:hypothetical protein